MSERVPLELEGLTKMFATPAGPVVAVQNVNARIHEREFACILGHSGCGKSTVLSIIAGLQQATRGRVVIDGAEASGPGADRGVVFQAPCLLPWLSVRENVGLAVKQASPDLTRTERRVRVDRYLELVGVTDAAEQLPGELSLGTQQCVSLARALSVDPRFLLLDEPFSMVDSLTRFELQDILLEAWERNRKVVVMVTHDVEEALYLADRLILMTDGPAARVGETLLVPFPRPRERRAVLEHVQYFAFHRRVIDFLENHAAQSTPMPGYDPH
jgi:nitrate/nitrite transport system ATP-binding protein